MENDKQTTDDSPPSVIDIENARKAVTSSPNSLELSLSYVKLLVEAATVSADYENVVEECQRALAIENPVEEDDNVERLRNEIKSVIQLANVSAIGIWMKCLGTGKCRLVPIKRDVEETKTKTNEKKDWNVETEA